MQASNTPNFQSFRSSNSLYRFKELVHHNYILLLIACGLGFLGSIFTSLRQVPIFISTTTLQLQQLNLAATSRSFTQFDFSVEQDSRLRLENSNELFKSDLLAARVEEFIRKHPKSNELIFASGTQFFFSTPKLVRINKISRAELRNILLRMINTKADSSRNNIQLTITSYSPLTTKILLDTYISQFNQLTQEQMLERIDKSTIFFKDQLLQARTRLLEAEEKLSQFIQKNPFLHSDAGRTEFTRLRERRHELIDELAAKNKIIHYYREQISELKKTTSKSLNSIRFKLQNELEQLEYDRIKFINEGYDPNHPGIKRIEAQIKGLKNTIDQQLESKTATNVAMETDINDRINDISNKILDLEDEVESKKISINNIDQRIKNLSPSFEKLPEREAIYNRLKRDADVASQLYLQLSGHVNMMNIRTASENGNWTMISDPTDPTTPLGVIPLYHLLLFGIMMGFALGITILLVRDTLDPRLITRDDVESMNFIFCGKISNLLAQQAQVLSTMGFIGSKNESEEPAIVTFASPDPNCNISALLNLTSYLASQRKATLTIALGDAQIPHEYGAPVSIGFANIYRHNDGQRDIVQVSDKDTFVSLQNLINSSNKKYSAIFLLFKDAINNPSYALGLKMSNRLLLVGPAHSYSLDKYYELTRGFSYSNNIYFAFSLTPKEQYKLEMQNEYYAKMYGKNTHYLEKFKKYGVESIEKKNNSEADSLKEEKKKSA